MYSVLDNYLVARFVSDLASEFSRDPDVSVDAEFPDDLRKNKQIIVSLRSDSHTQSMASNLYGVLHSVTSLAEYPSQAYPNTSIIWVNEDPSAEDIVQAGFYFVEVKAKVDNTAALATITPLFYDSYEFEYRASDNPVQMPESFKSATPASIRVVENSYEDNPRFPILNTHYDVDQVLGTVNLHWGAMYDGAPYKIEWYHWSEQLGPFEVLPGQIYDTLLPGIRIFFGHDVFHPEDAPDKQIITVEPKQDAVADVYAGRWRVSMAITAYAQSKVELGRLLDKLKQTITVRFHAIYSDEGMVIVDVSSSRASEVQYDTPNEYSFQGEVAFDISVPWFQASTYLVPLQSISIIEPAPDHMQDLVAAHAETPRFIYRTKFDALLDAADTERIK